MLNLTANNFVADRTVTQYYRLFLS